MDKIIDNRFERVEKALATLINSISTYNPSPALANDLVTADVELSKGLQQLSEHQSNHAKILSLRATSNALDAQIRDTLTLLTTTRAELLATPATTFQSATNPVSYSDLLSYARRISKFTLPASFREAEVAAAPAAIPETTDTSVGGSNTPKDVQTNGSVPNISTTNGAGESQSTNTAMEIDGETGASQPQISSQDTTLPIEWQQYLDTNTGVQFAPWPSEETIRRGALASIQILTDQGIDLESFDPAKSAELEAERQRIEEENERAREEEKARLEEERRKEMERRMSISGAGSAPRMEEQKPKVFQLEDFEDDDDD
ncbi:hypothetical protein BP6252_04147 [Coleophoma cylindrospora]|uniref:Mediator of RNA polymerase II transcription subunit 4 n=1 Tax=Coleophoma cylindrospora TaxID=1849047 RepID=A0A3D8RZN5_9HELO|nr:hypothetical protein BP6252_04147 [Coleophoma cylindrospora]